MTVPKGEEAYAMGKTVRRLLVYLAKYKLRLIFSIILMIGFSTAMGILPALMGMATDIITRKGTIADLQGIFVLFVLDASMLMICGYFAQRLLSDISQDALYDLRTDLFSHMMTLSLSFFDRQPIGELMSRVSNDIDVIDQFFSNGIQQVLQSVTTIIILTIVMIVLNSIVL